MKKIILKRLILALVIIVAAVGIAFAYKAIFGIRIEHFAQYIYPCEGQIVTLAGNESVISFNVLDEKNISELSEKSNIKNIVLVDHNGSEITAEDWNVETAGFYQGKYSAKKLSVTASFTEEYTIKTLKIIYPDKTESFDIGQLNIRPLTIGELASYTQISSDFFTFDSKNYMVDEDSTFFNTPPSALLISGNALNDGYSIKRIDFGIPGLGIDPSTVKFVSENTDYVSFKDDPDNKVYFLTDPLDALPGQEINIDITGTDFLYMIIALRHDKTYSTEPVSIYVSPVYTCIDKATGEQYVYGDFNYYIMSPLIVNDNYAASLLKEFGQ